jgi:hypothetical protein
MSTIQSILTIILAPTLIVGAIAFVLREFFRHGLLRDLEDFKARLQAEAEQSKLRMESDLRSTQFAFQTKFSLYHQRQADVIEALYEKLAETERIVKQLVSPVQSSEGRTKEDRFSEADQAKVDLARFVDKKRIYFDEGICSHLDSIIITLQKALAGFYVSQREEKCDRADTQLWLEAWGVMEKEVPPVRKALEQQFRQILSAIPSSNTNENTTVGKLSEHDLTNH